MKREEVPVRRTYRFRLAGFLYLSVTAFLAVAAISSQNNLLFWCLGLATAGIAVSGVTSGAGLVGVRVMRETIPDAVAGGEFLVRYRVENVNRFAPAFGLMIYERVPPRRRKARTPWQDYVSRPVAYVSGVGPRRTVVAEASARALRRGEPVFTDIVVASSFPFGLATKTLRFAQRRTGLVLPSATPLPAGTLSSLGSGAERSGAVTRRGSRSGEFFGLREYSEGDPIRLMEWRASARLDQWVVREHTEPAPRTAWVRVEIPSGTDELLVEQTMSLAAGVLTLATRQGLAFSLRSETLGISIPPRSGRVALHEALAALALADPDLPRRANGPLDVQPSPRERVVHVVPSRGGQSLRGLVLAADERAEWGAFVGRPAETRVGA